MGAESGGEGEGTTVAASLSHVELGEVYRLQEPGELAEVLCLLDEATSADTHRALGEHKWLDLVQGGRRGYAGYAIRDTRSGRIAGYAHLSRGRESFSVEIVVRPAYRDNLMEVGEPLLGEVLSTIETSGSLPLHLWIAKPTVEHDRLAAKLGFDRHRDLYQMRLALPGPDAGGHDETNETNRSGDPAISGDESRAGIGAEPSPGSGTGSREEASPGSGAAVRAFLPGRDEAGWLALNNRAFEGHPEQGGWDMETLLDRERESWFDPNGLLLYEIGSRLVGACWTKIHTESEPAMGEIYVICIDPAYQGRGLAAGLLRAGLDHIASQGLKTAMLYVDEGNGPAVRLYKAFGFSVNHIDRAFVHKHA